jgi:triosephosphate isomerase
VRKRIIAANWKMNLTHEDVSPYLNKFLTEVGKADDVEIVFIPSFTSIPALSAALKDSGSFVEIGAQNLHFETRGAFTGEVSAAMLRAVGVKYVLIGHSERRQYFHETDEVAAKKGQCALKSGLSPILCFGETLAEREANLVNEVLERQLRKGLSGYCFADLAKAVIAYEPVWAIGTGKTATAAQAQEAHAFIRSVLISAFGRTTAESVRIQYGGSVKPENVRALMSEKDIDGALVGGACLDPVSFAHIVRSALPTSGMVS